MDELIFEPVEHRYTVDGRRVISVTQVLANAGLLDLSRIPREILDRAAERGKRVHEAAQLLLRGRLDWSTVTADIGGYVLALDSFLRDSRLRPVTNKIEQPFHCQDHDFCGTPDAVAWYGIQSAGRRREIQVVLDWKTGLSDAVQFQLAAYAHALSIRHRAAVKLNADGTYRMRWFRPETLQQDLQTFLRAKEEAKEWVA